MHICVECLQISYLKQFHMILSDDSIKKRPMFNSLKKVASRIASHVIARLDPEPVSDPGLSSVGCDPSAVADQLEDGETPAPSVISSKKLLCEWLRCFSDVIVCPNTATHLQSWTGYWIACPWTLEKPP